MLEIEKRDYSNNITRSENKFSSIGKKGIGEEVLVGGKNKLSDVFVSSLRIQKKLVDSHKRGRSLGEVYGECLPGLELELNKLSKDEHIKVLDIGCGKGGAVAELKEKYKKWEVHGIDLSPRKDGYKTGTIVGGEASNLPYRSNEFHLVYSAHAYPYFPDKIKAMSEAVRVTKPGGVAIIQGLPGNVFEEVEASRVEGIKCGVTIYRKDIGNNERQLFKKITVTDQLEAAGIKVKNTKYGDASISICKSPGDEERAKKLPLKFIYATNDPAIAGYDHINSYYKREPLVEKFSA